MADIPISKMQVPGSEDTLLLRDSTAANKVQSATNGNLAKLDSSGNLADSGVSASSIGNLSSIKTGTCTTPAATFEKAVTVGDGTWEAKVGDVVAVTFSNNNTANSTTDNPVKLKVNNMPAKYIFYNGGSTATGNMGTAQNIFGRANGVIFYMYDGTNWVWLNESRQDGNNYPSVAVYGNQADSIKVGNCNYFVLQNKSYCHFIFRYANTYNGKLQMNINNQGAKDIYINGTISSSSNKTLPAGTYIAYYEDNKWYFRTDGKLTANITGTAASDSAKADKVNGATTGNLASLDANGNLADSGVASSTLEAITNVYGSKNLLSPLKGVQSYNGITVTPNDDGSITLSGSNTAGADIYFYYGCKDLPSSDYIQSYTNIPSAAFAFAIGDAGAWIISERFTNAVYMIGIAISANADFTTPVTFYPMIRDARISDNTYVPYSKTNQELTVETNSITPILNVLGAKNIYPGLNQEATNRLNTIGSNNIFTVNALTKYIFSCDYTGSKATQYRIYFFNSAGTNTYASGWVTFDKTFNFTTASDTCTVGLRIRFDDDTAILVSDIPNPMVRPANTDATYVPYAMTNRELTEKLTTALDMRYGNADNPIGLFAIVSPSTTNLPTPDWGSLFSWAMGQIYISDTSIMFYRTMQGGIWQPWVRVSVAS